MPYRRKGSPFWWVKFIDAAQADSPIYLPTTDYDEASALEAKMAT